eukprot:jgi/Botrbrau1/1515/Bobra.0107s0003.1
MHLYPPFQQCSPAFTPSCSPASTPLHPATRLCPNSKLSLVPKALP